MIEFGRTLREAREAKGYTVSQLANVTHLMHQIVEDLEDENFSRIAAPIYGRGFVKLYCEAVGLDPAPLVAEYMAIQNGEREATIHVRTVTPQPPTPPPPPPPPTPAPQPKAASLFGDVDAYGPNAESEDVKPAEPFVAPEPEPAPMFTPEPAVEAEPAIAPFRVPQPIEKPTPIPEDVPVVAPRKKLAPLRPPAPLSNTKPDAMPALPSNFWRVAVVVGVVAVLLWCAIVGAKALYRATMTAPDDGQPVVEPAKTEAPAPVVEKDPSAPRTPIEIPPLYID